LARLRDQRLSLLAASREHLLDRSLRLNAQTLLLLLRGKARALCLLLRLAARLLRLLLRFAARLLALRTQRRDRRQRLVARLLRVRPRRVQELLGLLLGRAHAVGGRAVGLRDPLSRSPLGVFAQLR